MRFSLQVDLDCVPTFSDSDGADAVLPGQGAAALTNPLIFQGGQLTLGGVPLLFGDPDPAMCDREYVGPCVTDFLPCEEGEPLDCQAPEARYAETTEEGADNAWDFPSSSSSSSSFSSSSASPSSPGSPSSPASVGPWPCPVTTWSFGTINTNAWVEHDSNHVELRVQASGPSLSSESWSEGDCGGSNPDAQSGTATGTINVPVGRKLNIAYTLTAIVEAFDDGGDVAKLYLDGGLLEAQFSEGVWVSDCASVTKVANGLITGLAAGAHTITVTYDTQNGLSHDATFGVDFAITSCEAVPA